MCTLQPYRLHSCVPYLVFSLSRSRQMRGLQLTNSWSVVIEHGERSVMSVWFSLRITLHVVHCQLGALAQFTRWFCREHIAFHTLLHETADACSASALLDRSSLTFYCNDVACHPLSDVDARSLFATTFVKAHRVHLTDVEIAFCAQNCVTMMSCPTSNAGVANGVCVFHKFVAAGRGEYLGD